jgi:hypothetical protein
VPPLKRISIGGYRAASVLDFEPRSVCALGEVPATLRTVVQKVLREARA